MGRGAAAAGHAEPGSAPPPARRVLRAAPARLAAAAVGLGLALGPATPAGAHQGRTTRSLLATARGVPGGVELDVLAILSLSRPAAALTIARFDLNRDGRFDATESALAAGELGPRAEAGLQVRLGPAPTAPAAREVALRLIRGRIEAAVLSTWRAPAPAVFQLTLTGAGDTVPFAATARDGATLAGDTTARLLPGDPEGVRLTVALPAPSAPPPR